MTHLLVYSLTVSVLPLARSLGSNNIRAEGATALAAILNETKITKLMCAPTPEYLISCQRPLTCLLTLPPPIPYSLEGNHIGAQGACALAAILNETKVTHLKCAAAPECLLPCQRPLTLPPPRLAA